MDHWNKSLGEEPPDYNGPWWGRFPSELQIQQIRAFLNMPALDGPEFAGILRREKEDAGEGDEGHGVRPGAELWQTGLSNVHAQSIVEGRGAAKGEGK
eukprot:8865209-Alexandrium_andersonii.AAC.1